jgi:hypothetical protein
MHFPPIYAHIFSPFTTQFPTISPEEVQVSIIQSAGHILNTYGKFSIAQCDVGFNNRHKIVVNMNIPLVSTFRFED